MTETIGPLEAIPQVKYDPPVIVTTAKALRDYDILRFDDTMENNPITRWAKDRFGVIQVNKWVVSDQNQGLSTRIKLALSNDEELPDVLFVMHESIPDLLGDLVESGKVMDIEEAFRTSAPARIKEAYDKNPDVWKTVTYKGKIWGIPQISDEKVGSPILWIRQDWLNRLGLLPPTTIEELEKVLHAFTYDDPDRNGKQDTIGFALSGKSTLNGWMGDASLLFGMYGDQPFQWNRKADGSLAYGSVEPSVKKALSHLNEWYRLGYLDPNFGTHDEQEAVQLFMSGKAGIISGPGWMGGWPLQEMKIDEPDFEIKPIPYPAGPDGKIGKIGSQISYGAYFFRKGFSYMDAMFAYMDQVYGVLIEDLESDFANGYADGYDYLLKDGKYDYEFDGATNTIANFFLIAPGSTPPGVMQGESIESRVLKGNNNTPFERKMAGTTSRNFLEGQLVTLSQVKYSHSNQFVGPYTPTMTLKWALLQKLEKETMLKMIYGNVPIESFDDFVRQWNEQGGADITREVNEWDRSSQVGDIFKASD
ncbi:extracellular solute-binding protein [Cohnella herbarum]|uniref:Extracellular solute-binding protein n=1 Tax=Cohnella herbarum TaxID=2728023 RepID=A0A7Z2VGF1_9BACL|nr:extracellular solute-binding protein [Cohnella herbarum]QJD82637.1 extracellular solute-binding protein [Cohnella herbarum]